MNIQNDINKSARDRKTKSVTPDQVAFDILLSNVSEATKNKKLAALSKRVTDLQENRIECPECGDMGPHEDNGSKRDLTYLCTACGCQWEG